VWTQADNVAQRTGSPIKVYHRYQCRRHTRFGLARRYGRSARWSSNKDHHIGLAAQTAGQLYDAKWKRKAEQQILIRSSQEATEALTSFLSSSSGPKEVYAPATGESIRIGEEIQSFSFSLGDSITSGLSAKMSKVS